MSSFTNMEKRKFAQLLGMGTGYVLDFSNRTFQEFVLDSVHRGADQMERSSEAPPRTTPWSPPSTPVTRSPSLAWFTEGARQRSTRLRDTRRGGGSGRSY